MTLPCKWEILLLGLWVITWLRLVLCLKARVQKPVVMKKRAKRKEKKIPWLIFTCLHLFGCDLLVVFEYIPDNITIGTVYHIQSRSSTLTSAWGTIYFIWMQIQYTCSAKDAIFGHSLFFFFFFFFLGWRGVPVRSLSVHLSLNLLYPECHKR